MEQVFSPSPDARKYRDLKQAYLKARNAVLPQFQVEAKERQRIFSILYYFFATGTVLLSA